VQGYTETVCGSLRGVRTVSLTIERYMPNLRLDSNSRIVLKAKFAAMLQAAAGAAQLGADFLAHAKIPAGQGVSEHARQVRDALTLSAGDYGRWRATVVGFDIYDRDNWEDELLTFEHTQMTDFGRPAWDRIVAAVGNGPVGRAVRSAAATNPSCRAVFGG
jgi:hypothetical protein